VPRERTVSAALVRTFTRGLDSLGIPVDDLLRRIGLSRSDIEDPDARIPRERSMRLWTETPLFIGDEEFGLHAAEIVHGSATSLGSIDVIDYVTRASATLGAAVERLSRYSQILQEELLEIRLETSPEVARIEARLLGLPRGTLRHAAEFVIATFLLRSRDLIGRDFDPLEVEFEHPAPEGVSEHRRIFRAPVRFDAPANAISFDAALLEVPVLSADSRLCALLDKQAEEILARLPKADDMTERVRRAVYDLLGSSDLSAERVARKLGITVRTLQRRMREEGQTYHGLLDSLRCELARHHLRERRLAVSEIAFLLGFGDVSALHRAFRRWTGLTPRAFRDEKEL
jgi:AraC-like DNA-binding protein